MPRTETKRTGGFLKGMLDGFRSSVNQPIKSEAEVEESLRPEHFQIAKTVRHGFPYQPTALGFDPVQRLLAIGTKNGSLRIFGRPGVDSYVQHVLDYAVVQIVFLINEGAMITICADDSLHLWNLRQKWPEIVHTLKFQKERITYCHLPFQSKWFYIGTERGNIHVVNIESFQLSGYVVNWNKAIELSRKTHPGYIVHLSDNPIDPNKLLIGYETGAIVMWDLRNRAAEIRFQCLEPLRAISWHHEGRQFMCCHTDGSVSTWNIKSPGKPQSVTYHHAKITKEGNPESCKPISKIEWKTVKGGDSFVIFSGGLPFDKSAQTPSLTVIHGKVTTVLEMEHNIIDFVTLCQTPWQSDFQDPYAVVVLLYNDLVVVDLTSPGYPCFQNPYPMDLHESPVTYCTYLADCPTDLIPVFYSVGSKGNKRTGFSEKEWPVNGGEWGTATVSYPEIIITGHADGSLKFWDASSVSLQVLYKLKTSKVFERPKTKSPDGQEEDPFAIEQVAFCPESRILCVAGSSCHVMVFVFKKQEITSDIPVLEIPIIYEIDDDPDCSPDCEYPPRPSFRAFPQGLQSSTSEESKKSTEHALPVKVKSGPVKKIPGFQVELVCLTPRLEGDPPSHITSLNINSSYGLMAYGNECGLAVIDIVQKYCLLNLGTPDLYGSADPYQRVPRSPKRNALGNNDNGGSEPERCRSPSEQVCQNPLDCQESTVIVHSQTLHYCVPDSSNITSPSPPSPPAPELPLQTNVCNIVLPKPPPRTRKNISKSEDNHNFPQITGHHRIQNMKSLHKVHSNNDSNKNANNELHIDLIKKPDDQSLEIEVAEEAVEIYEGKNYPFYTAWRTDFVKNKLPNEEKDLEAERRKKDIRKQRKLKTTIIDLRDESPSSPVGKIMYKIDSSFSRSRSSSMSSLENISSEAIQCLTFADSYSRKADSTMGPTLWVGTSLGSVLVILLTLPPSPDTRQTQPVIVTPSGTIFRLKGSILSISFLDYTGALVPRMYEYWKDVKDANEKDKDEKRMKVPNNNHPKNRVSPTSSSSDMRDTQFVVMASEKQARVVALPSQTCIYKTNLTETSFIVRAAVVSLKGTDSVCLASYVATGSIVIFSLPSLKILQEVDFLPLVDMRIARTFCFSNNGHGMYLCSPSELQKFTVSSTFCENVQDMLGTLFLTKDMPEPPKLSFFRGLFGGGPSPLDREELFGEASGKASKSIARHIPGNSNVDHLRTQSSSLAGELAKVRQGLTERGEALTQLDERTARMMSEAESFSNAAHQLMNKYKDRKWYQF